MMDAAVRAQERVCRPIGAAHERDTASDGTGPQIGPEGAMEMEPSWDELRERLFGMTLRELRGIRRDWFAGSLGGASTKAQVVGEMISQMRHWWHLPDGYGRQRVANVLRDIDAVWKEG